ncbi:2-iminoacetate synthase ThiH [Candidatus Enterovibrio escicola]|uniref:2-iminoacetate synthase n=1 Tax=Candidatus Enterovibrio escicola TaxID=1927127 RepID=A0A2A5T7J2_9GAMM|nr:2-iminoacetate synthase ThiH [Candidatus Enterovibrio escacola]PCS24096.1 2-iminoacetate synthase ThiH [Candidatus Enterovibrio escacola]
MSFSEYWKTIEWDDIRLSIYSKTASDVIRALEKSKRDLEDFKALVSPAAEPFLEQMAQQTVAVTRSRFGYTVNFYVPLYLSNLCANTCTYCGFSMENRIKRRTLSLMEIERECKAIKSMNFDNILLVTGEHQTKVGMEYFRDVLPAIKYHFSYLSMEVQPLRENEYAELRSLGLNGVMVYQETYNRVTYADHHLRGNKMEFEFRLDTPDRLARAGIDKIGIGVLIGLEEWRTDSFFVASHLDYLEHMYWQSRYSISFPRLRPCEGVLQPKSVMNDRQLVQLICAYRLLNPEVELSLSTRESPTFRDKVLPLGITSMSAASKTKPGGYANDESALEQFSVGDERSAHDVALAVKQSGFAVVWKDWHSGYSG